MHQDWFCDEVISGKIEVDVLIETAAVLAFRPPRPGFGREHIIVDPKPHVASLLEVTPELAAEMLIVIQRVTARAVEEHGGCQVLTTLGNEQHNRHLHWHIAAGDGVARFITSAE